MRIALLVPVLFCASAWADNIRTKDGATYEGSVLTETERGYLFKTTAGETLVIDFSRIDAIQRGAPRPADAPVAGQPLAPPSAMEQVQKLNFQLHGLQMERADISLFWPVTATIVGIAVTIGGLTSWSSSAWNSSDLTGPILVTSAGGGLILTGVVLFVLRVVQRIGLSHEIDILTGEIRRLGGIPLPD